MSEYIATYDEDWNRYFNKQSRELKIRIVKKISKVLEYPAKRHLKSGANFFVDEIGQYRLLYRIFEDTKQVNFYFVGDHKEYEKYYLDFF